MANQLDTSLVIKGDQSGAKKAVADTSAQVKDLAETAKTASGSINQVATGLSDTATAAGEAKTEIVNVGTAADNSAGKMTQFKALGLAAIGGFAAGILTAGIAEAFGVLSGAAGSYITTVVDGSVKVKADLEAQKTLIGQVRDAFNEASGAASSYGNNSRQRLEFEAQQNLTRLSTDYEDRQSGLFNRGADFGNNPLAAGAADGTPFEESVAKLRADLQAGTADVIAFRNEVASIASALPVGDENRGLAERLLGSTQDLADLQEEMSRAADILKAVQGNAEAALTALGGSTDKYAALGAAAAEATVQINAANAALASTPGATYDDIGKGPRYDQNGNLVIGGSFAEGGWTGSGRRDQIAGVVHGGEYVFDAAATARLGVGNLEAIRRGVKGYAAGGYVGTKAGGSDGSGLPILTALAGEFETLYGAVKSFGSQLLELKDPMKALGNVVLNLFTNLVSSLASDAGEWAAHQVLGLFGVGDTEAAVAHSGLSVGSRGSTFRQVSSSLFANAPRLHSGLAADEFPAILQTGEEVVPRGGRGGGTTSVTYAPTNVIQGGTNMGRAELKQLLDEHDREQQRRFGETLNYALSHRRR